MNRKIRGGLGQIVVFVLSLCLTVLAGQVRAQTIETKADYALLMDAETGFVFFEKRADELMAPASMSKLMTLYMLFERLRTGVLTLDDEFEISENAWRKGGSASGSSTMFAEVHSKIRVEDLIRGIIIHSGNDACIAVAENIAGSEEEFARQMTQTARRIGLLQSTFANSTGWPHPEHMMTARELGLLTQIMIQKFPDYYKYFAETEFTWNDIKQTNRNPLLYGTGGADGLKTGSTEASGYGLVGSAVRGDRRVILVVNGLESKRERARESRRLMNVAFRTFRPRTIFTAGTEIGTAMVFKGQARRVPLVVKEDVKLFVNRQTERQIKAVINYQGPVDAPIQQDQPIGTLNVTAPGMAPVAVPLFAAKAVPELGWGGKMLAAIRHLAVGAMSSE